MSMPTYGINPTKTRYNRVPKFLWTFWTSSWCPSSWYEKTMRVMDFRFLSFFLQKSVTWRNVCKSLLTEEHVTVIVVLVNLTKNSRHCPFKHLYIIASVCPTFLNFPFSTSWCELLGLYFSLFTSHQFSNNSCLYCICTNANYWQSTAVFAAVDFLPLTTTVSRMQSYSPAPERLS